MLSRHGQLELAALGAQIAQDTEHIGLLSRQVVCLGSHGGTADGFSRRFDGQVGTNDLGGLDQQIQFLRLDSERSCGLSGKALQQPVEFVGRQRI